MRERRWESESTLRFDEVLSLCSVLRETGLSIRGTQEEVACYLEEFHLDRLSEIDRLEPWPIDEGTLVQIDERWNGDFFLLAGKHHELFLEHPEPVGYLSLSHPWRVPPEVDASLHRPDGMFWIGFRQTHAFIRVRVTPNEIITPGETRGEAQREVWVDERITLFSTALEALDLPIHVERSSKGVAIASDEPAAPVACSWPDAFGPCQIEYTVSDRYELLVPAARLVSDLGTHPAVLRTFLSGYPQKTLEAIHSLQPSSRMLYRGYLQARLADLQDILAATAPSGRIILNLSEFQTRHFLAEGEESYAVLAVIGGISGFKIEVRLNRAPLPEEEMEGWLERLIGLPMVYSPLALY
jgi:hypothetical protein